MYEYVQQKLAGRTSATTDELRSLVGAFIGANYLQVSADAAIQYLAARGMLAREDARNFRLAA